MALSYSIFTDESRARTQFVLNSPQNLPTSTNAHKQQNPHFQRVVLMALHLAEYLF
jgi:hypothetical protein